MILTMNNFTFNDKHHLQIHGTAMGTRMAPSYANLFLAKFETDALSRAPYNQPHTWWRYIDDIFMIWTHSVDDLHAFTSYINSIHPTIKFTSNYSFTSTPFLDVNVFENNGNITTDLYTKTTDKHQYLLTLNMPKELFHSAQLFDFVVSVSLTRLSNNVLTNSNLTLTNAHTIYLSLIKKQHAYKTSLVLKHLPAKTLPLLISLNGCPSS